jgi:SAM-dependent methyltransferase
MFTRSARFYDAIYAFKDYAAEAARIREMIATRSPDARTVLDVACGTGMHLRHIQAWYAVEGLDLDPELLEIAREHLPGVALHVGNMMDFDLGKTFDAVTCLFSSVGYARTPENLARAIGAMARHLSPGGVLVVEPWLTPDRFEDGHLGSTFVDQPDLKIARLDTSAVDGSLSVMDFEYLVGTREGIEHFSESHVLGLFSHEQYLDAFRSAGLSVEHDPEGFMGRGLYLGRA